MNNESDDILDDINDEDIKNGTAPLTLGENVAPLKIGERPMDDTNPSTTWTTSNTGSVTLTTSSYPHNILTVISDSNADGLTPRSNLYNYPQFRGRALTLKEVAERLKVSAQTVRKLIEEGQLVAVQVSDRIIRVTESDLDSFIESKRA